MYILQLYIKNTEWVQRLTANKDIEQQLNNFKLKLHQVWRNHQKKTVHLQPNHQTMAAS